MDLPILQYGAIFLLGLVASFVGTTTGGIGIVIVPALIFFGLPPHAAVATMRLAIFSGNVLSLHQFHRAGKADVRLALPVIILGFAGAVAGSYALLWTPGPLAEKLLGGFILLTLVLTVVKKDFGMKIKRAPGPLLRMTGYVSLFFISVLSAFFSAATGILGRTTIMACFGQTYLQSAATRKIQGIAVGIPSLLIFAWSGIVDVPASLALVPGVLLGSALGGAYALRKGDAWARSLFIVVMLLAGLQLLFHP